MILKKQNFEDTKKFYKRLSSGGVIASIWGKESRFNAESISTKKSVLQHFLPIAHENFSVNDVCLDLGCGPGGFLKIVSPLVKTIIGADITPSFLDECQKIINTHNIHNASTTLLGADLKLPFPDNFFDKVLMVDTIHHLESPAFTISEVARVLKNNGSIIIIEPNILNPLLALFCFLDKNEHGLLRLGRFKAYEKFLDKLFIIKTKGYNGMLVGPDSNLSQFISNLISSTKNKHLNWLSPKLFIVAQKK